MGSTHNQDHYKVAGSKLEDRGIARRDRRRLAEETARLQNKATAKGPPRPATRKAASPAKAKAKKAATSEKQTSSKTPKPKSKPKPKAETAVAKSEKSTSAGKTRATSTSKKQAKISKPTAPPAELVDMRRLRQKANAEAAERLESLSLAKPWRSAKSAAQQTGHLVRRVVTLAVDVVTAPVTVVRLARQMRRRDESHQAASRSRK